MMSPIVVDAVSEVKVDNLLLAALLIAGGGRLVDLEDSDSKMVQVTVGVEHLDRVRLANEFERFAKDLQDPTVASSHTWNWVYSRGIMGAIEAEYRRLKGIVVNRRRG